MFAAGWLVFPGFGVIDLSVTWNASWPQVLEAGWGLFFTVIVGAAFALIALRPRSSAPAVAQLVVATAALAISTVIAEEVRLLAFVVLLALQTALVAVLLRGTRLPRIGTSRPLLVLAVPGSVAWLVYALQMWGLNRGERSDSDVTLGVDHYSVQGALALALAVLPLLAAPFVSVCAGVAAFYLALVSLAWPDSPGGLDRGWAVVAIVWGLAIVALTLTKEVSECAT